MKYKRKRNASDDLLRLLRFRLEFGEVYIVTGNTSRAAIIVVPLTGDKKRIWRYTYHTETVMVLQETGALLLEEVESIPDWAGDQLNYLGSSRRNYRATLPATEEDHE